MTVIDFGIWTFDLLMRWFHESCFYNSCIDCLFVIVWFFQSKYYPQTNIYLEEVKASSEFLGKIIRDWWKQEWWNHLMSRLILTNFLFKGQRTRCRFSVSGCPFQLPSMELHEDRECKYRPTRCPSLTCPVKSPFIKLLRHLEVCTLH